MMYGWYGDGGVGGWVAMTLLMLLFWGGVATVVILLIRGDSPAPGDPTVPLTMNLNESSTNASHAGK